MARLKKGEEKKYAFQFNIGAEFLRLVDRKSELAKMSRNSWLTLAIQQYLEEGEPIPYKALASWIFHERKHIIVRVNELTLTLMNEQCIEKAILRSTWVLDACLTKMALDSAGRNKK